MRDKLCVSERRTKILEFLVQKKQSTRCELATEFNVSTDTIDRDIVYLSGIAPVYTKQGNQGGVYILPEYRSYKNYLTDEEEECLYSLIKKSANDERRIICGIIIKRNCAYAYYVNQPFKAVWNDRSMEQFSGNRINNGSCMRSIFYTKE